MREITCAEITRTIRELCIEACTQLPKEVRKLLESARREEYSSSAKDMLSIMLKNAEIASCERMPICQDTGMAVVYMDIGQEVHLTGGLLEDAVNEGVRLGYTEGYLRKSIVADPLRRKNTGDNTPAVLHLRMTAGDRIRVMVAPKGFGSENMSRLKMLTPSQGLAGVEDFVLETVRLAGANPCPPIMLGVGIGGDFEQVAALAKRALVEPRAEKHPDEFYAGMEERLLRRINETGIGPQGFGGRTTALSIHILTAPTHIAGLPIAVNMGCHVNRHAQAIL